MAVESDSSVPPTGGEQAAPANAPAPPPIEQAPAPVNITTTDLEEDAIEAEEVVSRPIRDSTKTMLCFTQLRLTICL